MPDTFNGIYDIVRMDHHGREMVFITRQLLDSSPLTEMLLNISKGYLEERS